MSRKTRNIIAVVLSAVMATSMIAACAGGEADGNQKDNGINDVQAPPSAEDAGNGVQPPGSGLSYKAEKLALPEGFADFNLFAFKDNVLYVSGFEQSGGTAVTSIYAVSLDTMQANRLYSEPRNRKIIYSIDVDQGSCLWVLEYSSEYLADFDALVATAEETCAAIKINTNSGEIEDTIGLSLDYRLSEIFISDGYICITGNHYFDYETESPTPYELLILDAEGDLLSTIVLPDYPMITNAGGGIFAVSETQDGYSVSLLNAEEQNFNGFADIALDINASFTRQSGDTLFLDDGRNVYAYSLSTEETQQLFSWSGVGLTNFNKLYSLDDGSLLLCDFNGVYILRASEREEGYADNTETVIAATPAGGPGSIAQDTGGTLVLATLEADGIRHIVQAFNASNPNYTIEIKDYSVYNTDIFSTEGITKLRTEIIAGDVPDIIDLRAIPYGIPYEMYDNNGLFADLMPFLENDTDFTVSDFEPAVLSAMMTGGELINFVPEFSIMAVFGGKSDIAGGSIDSFSDLAAIANEPGEYWSLMERQSYIRYALGASNSKFYDFETGECYFDTDEFIDFLEFVKTQPDDILRILASGIPDGSIRFLCGDFMGIPQAVRHWFKDEDIALVGLPIAEGNKAMIVQFYNFGMTTASELKNGAWEFMKFFVSDRYFETCKTGEGVGQFSISRAVNERNAQEYRNMINSGDGDERDIALANELLGSVTGMYRYYEGLYNIVMEDAQAFFDGAITAGRAAELIQGRASVYMSERR